jgi:hypothetical protein
MEEGGGKRGGKEGRVKRKQKTKDFWENFSLASLYSPFLFQPFPLPRIPRALSYTDATIPQQNKNKNEQPGEVQDWSKILHFLPGNQQLGCGWSRA